METGNRVWVRKEIRKLASVQIKFQKPICTQRNTKKYRYMRQRGKMEVQVEPAKFLKYILNLKKLHR